MTSFMLRSPILWLAQQADGRVLHKLVNGIGSRCRGRFA
jgi:hypothetical protein